jgi:hypothetical protein
MRRKLSMRELTVPRPLLPVVVVLLLLAVVPGPGADAQAPSRAGEPRSFQASRTAEAPVIDGRLDEAAWAAAEEIRGFTQREPEEGEAASEETTVRILYDEAALYVGARLEDGEAVTTRLGRRDAFLESDWFQLWLDPHLDRQSGAGFWVNPSNVQIDMALYNDTWNDWSWDAVWSSATAIDAAGWTVEMRIPYSQLRFPQRDAHVWGIDVGRLIQRNREEAHLVHVPRTETGFVSRFARLGGIDDIAPPRSLEVMPYVVSRADLRGTVAADHPFTSSSELDASAGLDVKYGVTTNLTLTGTINPDFGQVEVDPAVVNLSQFETFFPEKRPFFIEGASNFNYGRGASNNGFGFNYFRPSFFYSRRIGRQPQAAIGGDFVDVPGETTILGAAKLTGKTEGGWTLGILDAYTGEETARFRSDGVTGRAVAEPGTNYFVSRIAREPSEKSRMGMLFTAVHRDVGDGLGGLHDEAYTGGVDGYRFFGDKDVIWEWFAGGSLVRGSSQAIAATQTGPAHEFDRPDAGHVDFDPARTSLDGWSAGTMVAKQTGNWRYNLKLESYSPGFDTNDLGFMTRTDLVVSHAALIYDNPEPSGRVRSRGWWVGKFQNWNHDGDLLSNGVFGNARMQLRSYWNLWGMAGANAETYDDRLTRGGPIAREPAYHEASAFSTWILAGRCRSDRRSTIRVMRHRRGPPTSSSTRTTARLPRCASRLSPGLSRSAARVSTSPPSPIRLAHGRSARGTSSPTSTGPPVDDHAPGLDVLPDALARAVRCSRSSRQATTTASRSWLGRAASTTPSTESTPARSRRTAGGSPSIPTAPGRPPASPSQIRTSTFAACAAAPSCAGSSGPARPPTWCGTRTAPTGPAWGTSTSTATSGRWAAPTPTTCSCSRSATGWGCEPAGPAGHSPNGVQMFFTWMA